MAQLTPTIRRDLFWGEPIVHVSDAERLTDGTKRSAYLSVSRRAMGCSFEIMLPVEERDGVAAATAALDLIEQLEWQMTVYSESSEVSRINALAAHGAVPVEARLFELLHRAVQISRATGGAFDFSAGALVRAWGFVHGPRRVPAPDALATARQCSGHGLVTMDRSQRTISFARPGVELNLGAIGKGYALDRAAELLRNEFGIRAALLHGGRSSVYALGAPPHDSRGWRVGLRHPSRSSDRIASLRLKNRAMGTSGDAFQFFESNGRRYGHVLDPRTGWPAVNNVCATVLAEHAADADAISTACFVLNAPSAMKCGDALPELSIIVIPESVANRPLCVAARTQPRDAIDYHIPHVAPSDRADRALPRPL